jgi:hypothetical protein
VGKEKMMPYIYLSIGCLLGVVVMAILQMQKWDD